MAVTMKNGVFWDVTPSQEPHGVTSQKIPFFDISFILNNVTQQFSFQYSL
jgi:hypothetical protein